MTDWKSVVHEHRRLVWHTVYRLVGNEADALDCFQNTFLEAVKVDRREPVRQWPALLRHLATARALDLLRSRSRQQDRQAPSTELATTASNLPDPQQTSEASELAVRLREAISELPANQAEAFCLCRLEGMTYGKAAEQLNIDSNSVGVLLHRASKHLQKLLAVEGSNPKVSKRGAKS